LVTSGLGGGFPAGYPVGTVAEVKRDAAQSLADVDVKPAAALDRARELMFRLVEAAGCPRHASHIRRPACRGADAGHAGGVAGADASARAGGIASRIAGGIAGAERRRRAREHAAPREGPSPAKPPSPAKAPPAKLPPPTKTPPPAGANDE